MKNVLFIESGVFEGGSFISLVKHIEALDKTQIKPIIVFFNQNKWVAIFKEKGYDVFLINDTAFWVGLHVWVLAQTIPSFHRV